MKVVVCCHSTISARSHRPGAAVRWLDYTRRSDACLLWQSGGIEPDRERRFVAARERQMARQYRRVIDRFMGVLPRGLPVEKMVAIVDGFIARLGCLRGKKGGSDRVARFPWVASFHLLGRDADNPHVHITLIDENIDRREDGREHSGPTAIGLSDHKSTEALRQAWADAINDVIAPGGEAVKVRAESYRRLAREARRAGELELAAYYDGCDEAKRLHVGPAVAAAVRERRAVLAAHLRASAAAYGADYFARQAVPGARPASDDTAASTQPKGAEPDQRMVGTGERGPVPRPSRRDDPRLRERMDAHEDEASEKPVLGGKPQDKTGVDGRGLDETRRAHLEAIRLSNAAAKRRTAEEAARRKRLLAQQRAAYEARNSQYVRTPGRPDW